MPGYPNLGWKPFSVISVLVPNDGSIHWLYGLMLNFDPQTPPHSAFMSIQVDPFLSTSNLFIGEGPFLSDGTTANPAVLTATNKEVILAGQSETLIGTWDNDKPLAPFWVMNDGTGTGVCRINVKMIRG